MKPAENRKFVYEFGKFLLDPNEKTLVSAGTVIHLPAKEFETLLMLVENNGRALSKEEMMSRLWQDSFVIESNLAKQISNLRKILNTNGERYIETLPKHGYRFAADVRLVAMEPAAPIILERRTVKRVTFDVEDHLEPRPLALPPARQAFYRSPWIALALVLAVIALGLLSWQRDRFFGTGPPAVDIYVPVRLTDDRNDDTGPQWTKDGRIRFTRIFPDNRAETWIMNLDGTAQSAVPMPEGKRIFSWSPDEKKVLFQKDSDQTRSYLSNADGSGEVLLPFRGGNWSPDSKMLAYHSSGNDSDIFVYEVESGNTRNITNSESFDADPSFSPDGRQIVFVSTRDGNGEIYSIDVEGGNLRRLTFDPKTDAHPAFSPDGTQISFTSDRENENADLYLMNADGGNTVKLTRLDKSNETVGPGGWSSDGTRIVFASDRNGKDDIYVVRAETVRPHLVSSAAERDIRSFSLSPNGTSLVYVEELDDRSGELRLLDLETGRTSFLRKTEIAFTKVDWSPLGDQIAFHDRVEGNSEVCSVRPDGREFRFLTNDPAQDAGASWSPDGRRLVFLAYRGQGSSVPQLFLMNADGSAQRQITPQKGWESDPVWTPDGEWIVFSCDRRDVPGNVMDICRIKVDGSEERRILFRSGHDSQPAVSPDGGRIAFVANSDGNAEIYLMNGDGSGATRVTRDSADDVWPEWTPDGKGIYFMSNRTGKFAIYRIELP